MARLIKVYNEEDRIVFEIAVVALDRRGAKVRGTLSLIGRRPGETTAIQGIDVEELPGGGVLSEYRVIIKIKKGESIKDKLKMDKAAEALEDLL